MESMRSKKMLAIMMMIMIDENIGDDDTDGDTCDESNDEEWDVGGDDGGDSYDDGDDSDTLLSQSTTDDLCLLGPPSGQGAGGGARTHNRRVPAGLRADSLTTEPPTPPLRG
ncbi:hypothetical protein PoB_004803300 [Plakobranchus ocellatus]|uniref:Secreted protein n=1 Tax=Plakobranchus ocellatus TaxID=259542 RepID=A0AAV4BQW8_9GAST|nr:hypothetical protein PoB_004803300 [Plakobranchus ocellatus]